MPFFRKNKEILIGFGALILVIGGVVFAGEIINNSTPVVTSYTLSDIFNKLTDPNYTASPSHNLYPSGPVAEGSMPSLGAIYNAIPTHKTLDGSTTTIETGIYATTTLTNIPGSGLLPENIASGTTMFGITGTYNCTP